MLAGQYEGTSYQTSGIDSFLVTLPHLDPPTIASGSFWVVMSYLPSSPLAPGIGGDLNPPIDGNSYYYTTTEGWVQMATTDLIVRAFITGQPSGAGEGPEVPGEFALKQNYPNPFNPSTRISFDVPRREMVSLKVFDLLGREVGTLANREFEAGSYSITWNAANVSAGVYFYRLQAGAFSDVKKLVLLR
jgi:hypothetical protein